MSIHRTTLFVEGRSRPLHNVGIIRDQSMSLQRPAKFVLLSALTVALAAYGLDCLGMTTPEPAMQSAPQMQAALGQPSYVHGVSFLPVAPGVVQLFNDSQIMERCAGMIAGRYHDPPSSCPTQVTSLRI